MRSVASLPEYSTVVAQTFSHCGEFYAAAARRGEVAIWPARQVPPSAINQCLRVNKKNPRIYIKLTRVPNNNPAIFFGQLKSVDSLFHY